jgi:glutathione synthase/RimK-type ligase-like ATP-grasp enzyme
VILILSNPTGDVHVAPVAAELSRLGKEFRIYDPAAYPGSSAVTVQSTANGVRTIVSWDGYDLDLAQVTSVWYRRPGDFILSDKLLPEEKQWVRSECSHCVRSAWDGMQTLWVSEPDAIRRASLKGVQMRTAIEMGFRVPPFIVTNDVDRASTFISSRPGRVVVKVLCNPVISRQQGVATLYTHLITEKDQDHLASVRFGPTLLQEFIEKDMDVRVTVIGNKLFAVGIQSRYREEARIDFRRAEIYDLPHIVLTLPERLHSLCIKLVSSLGLTFGAIDLILTPDGEYFFLEINPNGQWYWLEWVTGIPLAKTLSEFLAQGRQASIAH